MAVILNEFLLPQVVLDLISRLKGGRGPLGSWLGFQPKGFDPKNVTLTAPNVHRQAASMLPGYENGRSVRYYTYRIFDKTRVVMKLRAPGTGPAEVAQQPMGQATVVVCRFHQKIPLLYEYLGNLSPLAGPNMQIDEGGQDYIQKQMEGQMRQGQMTIEALAAGMMRDSLYAIQVGDDWFPQFAAPTGSQVGFQIPFLVPAGNKAQGNMLGSGNLITLPWNNPNALIMRQCENVKAAYVQLSQYPLTDGWINSTLWPSIITNTEIRNIAGTANKPFADYTRGPDDGMEGTGPPNLFTATLVGVPWLTFHFCDDTLALNTDIDPSYGTAPSTANLAKLVPDNLCIFATRPPSGDTEQKWCRLIEGGEYVIENAGQGPGALRTGWYYWKEFATQPSRVELLFLLNCIPALYVPSVVAPLTVIF
jgi:hypothetical protein